MLPLATYVSIAIGVSFLCSLMEATLLSVRMATLTEQSRAGSRGARALLDLKRTRVDDAISVILILNTVANTVGAVLAGSEAARIFEARWVFWFSASLTLAILVLSEIVPKTLGTVYASSLAPLVGIALRGLTLVMLPVLFISRALTRLLTRRKPSAFSRGELGIVIEIATRDGALTREEFARFENLLRLREVQVEDVMTPRTVVSMLPSDATVADLLARPDADTFSRLPVSEGGSDDILGYVLVRDALSFAARDGDRDTPIRKFLRPVTFIPELVTIDIAMKRMIEQRESVAMVTDERGGIAGLVTLEDLTETILGVEIVDESDRAVDMREVALELRDRRLERMRRKREIAEGEDEDDGAPAEAGSDSARVPID